MAKTEPPKCANCEGAHPANSTACVEYTRILERKKTRQNQDVRKPLEQPKKYTAAPIPEKNPWEERKKAQEAKNAQRKQESPDHPTDGFGVFSDIRSEFDKLNKHIDINSFFEKLKKLNQMMESCKNGGEKFTAFYNFIKEL